LPDAAGGIAVDYIAIVDADWDEKSGLYRFVPLGISARDRLLDV